MSARTASSPPQRRDPPGDPSAYRTFTFPNPPACRADDPNRTDYTLRRIGLHSRPGGPAEQAFQISTRETRSEIALVRRAPAGGWSVQAASSFAAPGMNRPAGSTLEAAVTHACTSWYRSGFVAQDRAAVRAAAARSASPAFRPPGSSGPVRVPQAVRPPVRAPRAPVGRAAPAAPDVTLPLPAR